METVELLQLTVAIIGSLFALWLATLSLIWARHQREDDRQNQHHATRRRELENKIDASLRDLASQVAQHDSYQREQNIRILTRLTAVETHLRHLTDRAPEPNEEAKRGSG